MPKEICIFVFMRNKVDIRVILTGGDEGWFYSELISLNCDKEGNTLLQDVNGATKHFGQVSVMWLLSTKTLNFKCWPLSVRGQVESYGKQSLRYAPRFEKHMIAHCASKCLRK